MKSQKTISSQLVDWGFWIVRPPSVFEKQINGYGSLYVYIFLVILSAQGDKIGTVRVSIYKKEDYPKIHQGYTITCIETADQLEKLYYLIFLETEKGLSTEEPKKRAPLPAY